MKLKKFTFRTVNSTNDAAIKIIKNSKNKFGIVVADKQIKGRGQHGKKWISLKGNLFVSIFFSIDKINLSLKQITKLNCYLIKKLLSFYYKKNIKVKLPNDLLIRKKKICGILQETMVKKNKKFMIVGVGVNLIKSTIIQNYPTTNLSEVTKKKISKKEVILKLQKIYENFFPQFSKLTFKTIRKI